MKKLIFFALFSLFACNQQSTTVEQIESPKKMKEQIKSPKKMNQNNQQLTYIADVSYSGSAEEIKTYITEENTPFFFGFEDSGILRFEWFVNEEQSTATVIIVSENASAFEEVINKALGSPVNQKFNKLFKRERATILGEVSDELKTKLESINPAYKTYTGGFN